MSAPALPYRPQLRLSLIYDKRMGLSTFGAMVECASIIYGDNRFKTACASYSATVASGIVWC